MQQAGRSRATARLGGTYRSMLLWLLVPHIAVAAVSLSGTKSFCETGHEATCQQVLSDPVGSPAGGVGGCEGNHTSVVPARLERSAVVDALHVYTQSSGSTASEFLSVVYHDAGGVPGELALSGVAVVLPVHAQRGWLRLPIGDGKHVLPCGDYWIGVLTKDDFACFGVVVPNSPPRSGPGARAYYTPRLFVDGVAQTDSQGATMGRSSLFIYGTFSFMDPPAPCPPAPPPLPPSPPPPPPGAGACEAIPAGCPPSPPREKGPWDWTPPAANSTDLLPFLRNTRLPKLAYSTWVGWYEDGGLNETSLFAQVTAMADTLRPHGWTHIMHDYGWQDCGGTYSVHRGCIYVDHFGRQYPSPERFPSTAVNTSYGSWKPFVDQVHAKGIGFGIHLMHGVPKIAAAEQRPILGSEYTAADIVANFSGSTCATFIPDSWMTNSSHPGTAAYYDSIVAEYASSGIDFLYLDGILGTCEGNPPTCTKLDPVCNDRCHLDTVVLIADSIRRLGNGMFIFVSAGPWGSHQGEKPFPGGCSFENITRWAPYVRVGQDTADGWGSMETGIDGTTTRLVAPLIQPRHYGDLASLMVGKVHRGGGTPGPDYFIPSKQSHLSEDEVYTFASMVAIFRSSWWPSGVLSENDAFATALLTNDAVIRITMSSNHTRQVNDATSHSLTGSGVVWTSDDTIEPWKYVLLVNMGATSANVSVDFADLGLDANVICDVLDMWQWQSWPQATRTLRVFGGLRSHASALLRLSNCTDVADARKES